MVVEIPARQHVEPSASLRLPNDAFSRSPGAADQAGPHSVGRDGCNIQLHRSLNCQSDGALGFVLRSLSADFARRFIVRRRVLRVSG